MDFFGHQDHARRLTRRLLVYYLLAVLGTILSAYVLIVVVMGALEHEKQQPTWALSGNEFTTGLRPPFAHGGWFDPALFFAVTGGTALLVGLGSAWKTMQFSGGGSTVATLLGGRPVPPGTSDPDKQRLLNVVEEMALASGLPVPAVYLLEDEEGINAFAAGYSPADAVIGVTRGTLDQLTRDELQGVVAHEFSHILNGDMRLNMRLTCMTHGILFLAVIGRMLLESLRHVRFSSGGRRGKGGGGIVVVILGAGLGLMLIGSVGHFFAALIQAAVSRQREFLADAAAVQFTRNPHGIGGALLKIASMGRRNRLHSAHAMEAGHFFFCDNIVSRWFEIGSTHPSLEERIRRVAPDLLDEEVLDRFVPVRPGTSSAGVSMLASPGAAPQGRETAPMPGGSLPDSPADPSRLAYAAALLADLPPMIQNAVREPYGARALVFAILLSRDPATEAEQLRRLQRLSEPMLRQEALLLREPLRRLDRRVLLPLVDLAQPTLRLLSPAAYREFRQALDGLIEADGEIALLEYALLKLVQRRLDPAFHRHTPESAGDLPLESAWPDIQILLGALAHHDPDPQKAYDSGTSVYGAGPGDWTLPPAEACGLSEVDQALQRLSRLSPEDRPTVVEACARAVMNDAQWSIEEGECLRAIADHLDCPIPPLIR